MITVSQNYTVTIPKEIRDAYGIQPGDCIDFEIRDRTLVMFVSNVVKMPRLLKEPVTHD